MRRVICAWGLALGVALAVAYPGAALLALAASATSDDDPTSRLLESLFGASSSKGQSPVAVPEAAARRAGWEAGATGVGLFGPAPGGGLAPGEEGYSAALAGWQEQQVRDSVGVRVDIDPRQLEADGGGALEPASSAQGYGQAVFRWTQEVRRVRLLVRVPQEGLYRIRIDYFPLSDSVVPVERGIQVNGRYPFLEARRIVLPKSWKSDRTGFEEDALGNQLLPRAVHERKWQTSYVYDPSLLHDEPLRFHLKEGLNEIALVYLREPILLGRITIESPARPPSYAEYLRQSSGASEAKASGNTWIVWEAEFAAERSHPYVRPETSGDVSAVPYRGARITFNTMGGGSWKQGGQSITWAFSVGEDGYYRIAVKYIQYFHANMPVFRTIRIDGEIPFAELTRYRFDYAPRWRNEVLAGPDGQPYRFFLKKGRHTLSMTVNPAPYRPVIEAVRQVMGELNALTLDIKKATGNTRDTLRDWDLASQMPDLPERLRGMAARLREQYQYLTQLGGRRPAQARSLAISADRLESLAREPNEVPFRFQELTEGSGSVAQRLGDLLLMLPEQPLQLDRFYVYVSHELPNAEAPWWRRLQAMAVNFWASFTRDYTRITPDDEQALKVWVRRPRQYVELMQQLVNSQFTRVTGIKVSLALMTSEQKLVLASAAGRAPDVALGLSSRLPYDLALRGALAELNRFESFHQVVARFSRGALLPFELDGGLYALPETQDFWVLFYRTDLLKALGLPVPDTWDDVIDMLPSLQRYGMNFYVPLSGVDAFKSFSVMAPFFYQRGVDLFAPDGTRAGLDDERALEGFELSARLFTIYNLPLQVPNFYNHFREGSLPLGISNFGTYVQLTVAASELAGRWGIAPMPGIRRPDGSVARWAPGTGTAAVVFASSRRKHQAWEFLKWWTSAEAQREFGMLLQLAYGPEFMWNTANLEAFDQLPWPPEHAAVIREQWRWLKDVPRVPGDYMLERELSNAWNRVVFGGVTPRRAIEDAVILANREILKKLDEFRRLSPVLAGQVRAGGGQP